MIRVAGIVLVLFVLVPAAAGTSTTRPPVALSASPAHVTLAGSGQSTIRVTNSGNRPVLVDVTRAGFSLDLRGRPRISRPDGARAAGAWLTVRPHRLALGAGASSSLTVSSRVPRRAEPGDYDALVLLTTRPQQGLGLAVRMRIGVVVVVRAPGRIVRRLELGELRVRRAGRTRMLELLVANRGNVTETLGRNQVDVVLLRQGRAQARLRPTAREVRPRTSGIVQFSYRGRLRGWVTARVRISAGGAGVQRSFRIRL